jgi:hypothetical protein
MHQGRTAEDPGPRVQVHGRCRAQGSGYVEDAEYGDSAELIDARASLSRSAQRAGSRPWQETPAGYRFSAAAADSANDASTNRELCL